MSTTNHLPQRHLNLLPRLPSPSPSSFAFSVRPADRFSPLLNEIEGFLLTCTYEEIYKFWQEIGNLRQRIQNSANYSTANYSDVPQFLTGRRKQRDLCRILEVLADLPYPKLHVSSHLAKNSGDRRNSQRTKPRHSDFGYPHLAIQR